MCGPVGPDANSFPTGVASGGLNGAGSANLFRRGLLSWTREIEFRYMRIDPVRREHGRLAQAVTTQSSQYNQQLTANRLVPACDNGLRMTFQANLLRSELLPSSQLEELFFDAIVRLTTCASFLAQHIERDPEFTNPETTRRLRLLLATENKLRYNYEEFRRLKMARLLQLSDPDHAARPLLAVVATHTSRNGFRTPPRNSRQSAPVTPAAPPAQAAAKPAPVTRPATPGRNSQCPCNSGRKYKHCCLSKPAVAA